MRPEHQEPLDLLNTSIQSPTDQVLSSEGLSGVSLRTSLEPSGTFLVAISPVPISEAPGTQKTASR